MKKTVVLMVAIAFATVSQAQFDAANLYASVSGNYTMYKGDFQQKTPGVKLDIGYSFSEKVRGALGFTYHLPIKGASTVTASNGISSTSVPSEIVYNFTTISVLGNYTFGESEENPVSFYSPLGVALVMTKYKENLKGTLPTGYAATDQLEPGKESGFVMNLGLGAQYNFGSARAFADASLVLPANQVNNQYVANVIPSHLVFNAGIRIPFGARSSD